MTPFAFRGLTFNADEEGAGAFTCFDPAYPNGTDTGPHGMVTEMETFLRLTKGKKALVDVGALFGIFSLAFTTQNPGAVSHAIEASDQAASVLLRQCEGNRDLDIRPIWAFVGDTQGRHVSCTRDWRHIVANLESAGREMTTVTEVTIDSLGIPLCDAMKIDVEAYECQVLRGARNLIMRDRPILFVECHMATLQDNGESRESLMHLMHELRYDVRLLDGTSITEFGPEEATRVIGYPL